MSITTRPEPSTTTPSSGRSRPSRGETVSRRTDGPHHESDPPISSHTHRPVIKAALLCAGCVLTAAGIAGALLPGIPTTPFLLLASWCFSRSSQKLHTALRCSPLLGPFLRDWDQHRGVRRNVKILACMMMTGMVTVTLVAGGVSSTGRIAVLAGAACGLVVILRLRTIR